MARSLRLEYPGAYYHVMARGNHRERIFVDDTDRRFFLQTLEEACTMTGWRVHGWVLMGNHYHCLIETPEANLVAGMQWLQNTYTRRFNTRGRLFGDRYKAVVTEGGRGDYYGTLLDYIHLSPVRAGLVSVQKQESVKDYPWSSVAGGYALPARRRAPWLACEEGLGAFDPGDNTAGRAAVCGAVGPAGGERSRRTLRSSHGGRRRARQPSAAGLVLGQAGLWRKNAEAGRTDAGQGPVNRTYRSGAVVRAHGASRAEELVKEGLAVARLAEQELEGLPGSDPRKLAVARAVWEQTTVSMQWIGGRLRMRSAANVSRILRRNRAEPLAKTWKRRSVVSEYVD